MAVMTNTTARPDGPEGLRVLVCGGRDYADSRRLYYVLDRIEEEHGVSCIIHGAARGADSLADEWAYDDVHHPTVGVQRFRADWNRHGRGAGHIRNQQMLDEGRPDLVVAMPGGRGTANMVERARRAGVKVLDFRDSDQSPKGGDAEGGTVADESATPKGDRHD